VHLARHAENVGANGVLVVSPFYWNVAEEALYKHFKTVAESVEISALVYSFPLLSGINLFPTLVARLAEDYSNLVDIKDMVAE
jgi:dihydrodipicolinate synthase/N-acetylneuraminate lyase